jgi:hypothetical protein
MTQTGLTAQPGEAPPRPGKTKAGAFVIAIAAAWPAMFLAASSLATGGWPHPAVLVAVTVAVTLPFGLILAAILAPMAARQARTACSRAVRAVARALHAHRYT